LTLRGNASYWRGCSHVKLLRDGSDAMLIADYVAIGALIDVCSCFVRRLEENERVMRGVGDSATAAD
jgi:hypothetical protein